jgi:NitT/TauT family transport system permease protein
MVRGQLSPRKDLILGLAGLATFIGLWCVLTYGGFIKPLFLPSPSGVWEGIMSFAHKGWLDKAIISSTWRVIKSLFLVIVVGVPIGILMGAFAPVDAFLRKIVNAGKAIPPPALIGLIVLWFSIEEKAKVIFLFLGAIFYLILLVKNAVQNVREEYVKVVTDMGANNIQVITKVLIPGAMPQIWEAVTICSGIMWTYIVLAEFINSSQEQIGLGYLLQIGSRTQESGMVYGALILIVLISVSFDFVMNQIAKRYFSW